LDLSSSKELLIDACRRRYNSSWVSVESDSRHRSDAAKGVSTATLSSSSLPGSHSPRNV